MALETQANQELVGTFFDEVINAHNEIARRSCYRRQLSITTRSC
jgi:hypothetical protein